MRDSGATKLGAEVETRGLEVAQIGARVEGSGAELCCPAGVGAVGIWEGGCTG
jgi:hypothetical protein